MNKVFLIGKIKSKIEFNFIYNESRKSVKHYSIASANLQIDSNNEIEITGYDKIADIMYRELRQNETIMIYGRLINIKNELKVRIYEFTSYH